MEVSSFVLLYFGTKIFVRCSEVSVVQRCSLIEVPLYFRLIQAKFLTQPMIKSVTFFLGLSVSATLDKVLCN